MDKHKLLLYGGIALVVLVIGFLALKGGGGTTSGIPSASQLQALSAPQVASINANASNQQAALSMLGTYETNKQATEVAIDQIRAQYQEQVAQIQGATNIAQINATSSVQIAQAQNDAAKAIATTVANAQMNQAQWQEVAATNAANSAAQLGEWQAYYNEQGQTGVANAQQKASNNNSFWNFLGGGLGTILGAFGL